MLADRGKPLGTKTKPKKKKVVTKKSSEVVTKSRSKKKVAAEESPRTTEIDLKDITATGKSHCIID